MKTIFVFNVNHGVDLITNSSSELFVLKGKTKEIVEEMITSIYPNYLDEYESIKHIDDISVDQLNVYFDYLCSPHIWPAKRSDYPIIDGFTFEELYTPKKNWRTGVVEDPAWNGEIQYELKNNLETSPFKFNGYHQFVTDFNFDDIKNKLDPNKEMYFLFSIDENPNWDYQEKLMDIGERFHLG